MLFVLRNTSGSIISLHREAVAGGEPLPGDHPDVLAFLHNGGSAIPGFGSLDASLVRVIEDLIDVLISRNVIRITDLPPEAQHKLLERKRFRESVRENSLQLLPPDPH